jgi:hypothetical protein
MESAHVTMIEQISPQAHERARVSEQRDDTSAPRLFPVTECLQVNIARYERKICTTFHLVALRAVPSSILE